MEDKKGIISIHGKDYMTVARRVELAHQDQALEKLTTEVLCHIPVVIKATVLVKGKEYTGISAVDTTNAKIIEKQNPYEVAETSAVGRALGFAGYGIVDSIASADEMAKAGVTTERFDKAKEALEQGEAKAYGDPTVSCEVCGQPAFERKGTTKGGKAYHGVFCSSEDRSHTRWLWN